MKIVTIEGMEVVVTWFIFTLGLHDSYSYVLCFFIDTKKFSVVQSNMLQNLEELPTLRSAFYSPIKYEVDDILTKVTVLCINLNIDG